MIGEPFEFDDFHDLDEGDDDPSITVAAEWAFHLGEIVGEEVRVGLQAARAAEVPVDYAVQGAVDSLLRIAASLFLAGINKRALPKEVSFGEWAAKTLELTQELEKPVSIQ